MDVESTYHGGPLHGLVFSMNKIPDYQFFFHSRDRKVFAYKRNELDYHFDKQVSDAGTARYDEMVERIKPNDIKPIGEVDLD